MMTDTGAGASEQPTDRRADDEQRCAHCAARLAPGIGWCAQCYAPIVSGGDAAPAEADAPDVPDALDVADAPRTEDAASEDGAPDTEAAAAEADRMIAGLAATSGSAGSTPGSLWRRCPARASASPSAPWAWCCCPGWSWACSRSSAWSSEGEPRDRRPGRR